MKVYTNSIRLTTTVKTGETNITEMVESILLESGITNGTALIYTGHTTASIHLNNADEGLEDDLHNLLNDLVPNKPEFKHNKGDYGRNADAHIKCVLIGNSISVPITNGRLALGQWQAIYFSEFDGPRKRLLSVKITGE
ncbi:MAG: secondary thiamine-phosphate synthase enzyme YjbQ [Thermodesulfobacteriota bacterium]